MKAFGDIRQDPYFWMRYRENPDTMAYIKEENDYTSAVMEPYKLLTDKLYKEFLSRIKQTDISAPAKRDNYWYYTRTEEGKQYPILCRKTGSLNAPEEILMDVNKEAEGKKFFSLGSFEVSPNHKLLAYSTDTTGYREYNLRFRDLSTGKDYAETIERTSSVAWAADNKTIFYGKQQPKTKRDYQIHRHLLGSEPSNDALVYEEKEERFNADVADSLSREYVYIVIQSGTTSETRYIPSANPSASPKVLLPRQEGITYDVEHHSDTFYVRINDTGRNFRVVAMPVANPAKETWREVIPPSDYVYVESHLALKNHLVYLLRVNGLHTLLIDDLAAKTSHDVKFEEQAYVLNLGGNREFDTNTLRFNYSSMVIPPSVYDYNLTDRSRILVKRQEVLGGYDPMQYAVERVMVTSHDGVKVPMTIAYKKGFTRNGQAPFLLYGYGAYSIPMDPGFSAIRLSLLDRGFAYAIAHIRGGTDLGYTWYEAGKLLKKKNTFKDFIACAQYLVDNKYTSPSRLAIQGGSAGGLLVGAAVVQRPDLFHTVLAAVPFVDVVSSLSDTTIPLTTTDADEFGSPLQQEYYEYQKSYSPYDNTQPAKYPDIYISSGLNDSQVPYWEPLKWIAKLRAVNQSKATILLHMNTDAGHGGASGRYDRWKETAKEYAFLLRSMGIRE